MRVLLRNRRTRRYYVGHSPNNGSNDPPSADPHGLDFGTVPTAARFTLEEHLPDMEIVLSYDSCGCEIALPVLPEWCLFDERALHPVSGLA